MADIEHLNNVREHKELFTEWINDTKGNSTFINQADLEEIKNYLISIRDDVSQPHVISLTLKRRIKSKQI